MVCLVLELVGPWVELGFSVGMEAFDELLLLNVPCQVYDSSPFISSDFWASISTRLFNIHLCLYWKSQV